MKLIFNLCLMSFSAHASLIQITFSTSQEKHAHIIKNIFINNYSIPRNLIKLNRGELCKRDENYQSLHLCLNNENELSLIGHKRGELIKKSILSFSEKKGGNSVVTY